LALLTALVGIVPYGGGGVKVLAHNAFEPSWSE
jgi:hypothetical protein